MSETNQIVEKAQREIRDIVDRSRRDSEDMLTKMEKRAEELEAKSIQNFAEWRDYLHRYYVLILAFIGGSGILSITNDLPPSPRLALGIYLALGGVMYGFFARNLYFYLERRWCQISNYVSSGFNTTHTHPEVENDPVLASRLNLSAKINEYKVKLKVAKRSKDKKQAHYLKGLIRGHKMERSLMKYLGQQFGYIEAFWVGSVVFSFILTSVGVIFIFVNFLNR